MHVNSRGHGSHELIHLVKGSSGDEGFEELQSLAGSEELHGEH